MEDDGKSMQTREVCHEELKEEVADKSDDSGRGFVYNVLCFQRPSSVSVGRYNKVGERGGYGLGAVAVERSTTSSCPQASGRLPAE